MMIIVQNRFFYNNIEEILQKHHIFPRQSPIKTDPLPSTIVPSQIISSGLDSFKDDYRESCKNLIKEKREPSIKLFEYEIKDYYHGDYSNGDNNFCKASYGDLISSVKLK